MAKNNNLSLSVGPRYVFFSSLGHFSHDNPYAEIYASARGVGESYVAAAAAALGAVSKEQMNSNQIQQINTYIQMIGDAAKNELSLTSKFLENCRKKFAQRGLEKIFTQYGDTINPDSPNFNYTNFLILVNKVMAEKQELELQREKMLLDNMKLIEHNIANAKKKARETIEQSFYNQTYADYRKKLRDNNILQAYDQNGTEHKFQNGLSATIASKATSIINQILKDQNLTLQAASIINPNLSINTSQLEGELSAYVVHYLTDKVEINDILEKPAKELREQFIQNLQQMEERLSQNYIDNVVSSLEHKTNSKTQKDFTSIEELSLGIGEGLGDMFLKLTEISQKNIIQKYGTTPESINFLNQIVQLQKDKQQISAAQKGKITKILNEQIAKQAKINIDELRKKSVKDRKKIVENLQKQQPTFFNKSQYNKQIQKQTKISVTTTGISQLLVAKVNSALAAALSGNVKVLGNKYNLKADLIVNYQLGQINNIQSSNLSNYFSNLIQNRQQTFLDNLKQINKKSEKGNNTKIKNNVEAYFQSWQSLLPKIRALAKVSHVKEQDIINDITQFLDAQISIKEYTQSGNLGFHGGSLGGGGNPDTVLTNISKMYQLGGITPIDRDLLYFAAINCASSTIGSALKEPLENYLLGGAALMMFDDGFTATSNFLSIMKANLGFSQGTLHLFSVNGKFVPASFVYSSIYNSLTAAYNNIIDATSDIPSMTAKSNNKVSVTNNISQAAIPSVNSGLSIQSRWNSVAKQAAGNVTISFTFLGGMLDIFEQIQQAFNI